MGRRSCYLHTSYLYKKDNHLGHKVNPVSAASSYYYHHMDSLVSPFFLLLCKYRGFFRVEDDMPPLVLFGVLRISKIFVSSWFC